MKRSGFKPAALRIPSPDAKLTIKIRRGKCAICSEPFTKMSMTHRVCSAPCALALVQRDNEKADRARQKLDRAETAKRKEAIKSRSEWIADCQVAFNAYIRYRDKDCNCICCDKPFEPQKPGGSMDAGHYLSRGSAPHLRFEELNCFGQRKNCNRPGGTTREKFRAGVERRIGLAALEALESDQTSQKWTIDDLKAIKAAYKAKLKELKAKS